MTRNDILIEHPQKLDMVHIFVLISTYIQVTNGVHKEEQTLEVKRTNRLWQCNK